MKQVLIRQGRVVVEEMPEPPCGPGDVLVRAAFSLISPGTETAHVRRTGEGEPAAARWRRRARKIGEVAQLARYRGLGEAAHAVRLRLAGPSAVTGYSLSGTVLRVGPSVRDLAPGRQVACAGAGHANHAEVVAVPRNLVAPLPPGVTLEHAATATLGAIALHGVRQADARLGEIACVIGLGAIGQLVVGLLTASGCRVVGSDLDPSRIERARALGLEAGAEPPGLAAELARVSDGRGADVVLLTASTDSSEPARQALEGVRRRGRIVVVGAVGLNLDRNALYEKEAELYVASSCGPGRYDPAYERDGADYPYAYVRWTENRNLAEYLRVVAAGRLAPDALVEACFPVERAPEAYVALGRPGGPLAVLLRYPHAEGVPAPSRRSVEVVRARAPGRGVAVALVGPGSFARATHLPNLVALAPRATLRVVVGRTPNAAREAARRFAAARATTDLEEVLDDAGIDAVVLCTRHHLHAEQAARALEAGKAVLVEKPAAIDEDGLARLRAAVAATATSPTVGFNRRFAPLVTRLAAALEHRRGPLLAHYSVTAERLPGDHWTLGPQGGGRLIGEACHMIDLLGFLVGSPRVWHAIVPLVPRLGEARAGDDFALTCRYDDGSVTTLHYATAGSAVAGKERLDCRWDGTTAQLDDFRALHLTGEAAAGAPAADERAAADKGHAALLARFVDHVKGGGAPPIAWPEIDDVTSFTLALDRELRGLSIEPGLCCRRSEPT